MKKNIEFYYKIFIIFINFVTICVCITINLRNYSNIKVADSILRKPEWLKIKLENSKEYSLVSKLVEENGLHTICGSGKCPNMNEC